MCKTSRTSASQRGNVAMLSAFFMLPMVLMLGGGVDIVRATASQSKLNSALEGAALASASLTNSRDQETVVREYLAANLSEYPEVKESLTVDVVTTTALNSRTVTITASATIDTYFLNLAGYKTLPVNASTVANQSATNVELSLVLDISSSMKGDKITKLKEAASDFVEQILNERNIDRTSMNLVPFGGTVNIGDLFDTYVAPVGISELDPARNKYNGRVLTHGPFRFSLGEECIEVDHDDFDGDLLTQQSHSQVPHFWRWNNFNPWCPEEESAVLFNTNDVEDLQDRIDEMTLSDGTGMDIGAMWGLKALSPAWSGKLGGDFNSRPGVFADDTQKVMVVMTDGDITQQNRPRDWTTLNTHTNRPNNNPTSDQQGNQGNNSNMQRVWPTGGATAASGASHAVGNFKQICDEAKSNGIVVYTVGFQISAGSTAETLLKYCASDTSKYYLVESLDIQSAFDSIAASVNSLRITG